MINFTLSKLSSTHIFSFRFSSLLYNSIKEKKYLPALEESKFLIEKNIYPKLTD